MHSKNITNYRAENWYRELVFNDEEFVRRVDSINDVIMMRDGTQVELDEEGKNTSDIISSLLRVLASDFGISLDDVLLYMLDKYDTLPGLMDKINSPIFSIAVSEFHDTIEVHFKRTMKHKDYVKAWNEISTYLAVTKTRNRGPEDPLLIYCIFRAKREHTFSEIFTMYQQGKLDGYENKPTNQFQSVDSIKDYYYKYRPVPLTLNS